MHIERGPGWSRAELAGEIDLAWVTENADLYQSLTADEPTMVILDVASVTFRGQQRPRPQLKSAALMRHQQRASIHRPSEPAVRTNSQLRRHAEPVATCPHARPGLGVASADRQGGEQPHRSKIAGSREL